MRPTIARYFHNNCLRGLQIALNRARVRTCESDRPIADRSTAGGCIRVVLHEPGRGELAHDHRVMLDRVRRHLGRRHCWPDSMPLACSYLGLAYSLKRSSRDLEIDPSGSSCLDCMRIHAGKPLACTIEQCGHTCMQPTSQTSLDHLSPLSMHAIVNTRSITRPACCEISRDRAVRSSRARAEPLGRRSRSRRRPQRFGRP